MQAVRLHTFGGPEVVQIAAGKLKLRIGRCLNSLHHTEQPMQVMNANVCIHAGTVSSLPAVFKVVDGQFVIDQQGASEAAIRQTVAACPSGALQITEDKP